MKSNRVQPQRASGHLSDAELQLLLSDEEGKHVSSAVAHLDGCESCQSQLTALASGPEFWSDARALLSGEQAPRWEPDMSQSLTLNSEMTASRLRADDEVLKLLASPNHPEMLGRLGRYDIEKVIGSGGMGIVLKAHDSELNRPIAIKVLAPHLSNVGAARERFAREGRAAAAVVHEHVVAIYNVEADGALPFLIMQYVAGRSLQSRVDADGPLGVEEILRIGMQGAAGLAAAHAQGLVHRDVKPSNILLEDTVERAVLTDFGLARAMDDMSLTQTGIIAGTPHYMSPEQATGGSIDARSDLFSLGGVLYFMATGHPPFRASAALAVLHRICRDRHRPVRHVNKDVPDELADLIDRLLEKKPGRRPVSAESVRDELASLLSHVQQFGCARRRFASWRGRRARQRFAIGAIAAAAIATATATWFVNPWPHGDSPTTNTVAPAAITRPNEIVQAENALNGQMQTTEQSMNRAGRDYYYLHSYDAWRREAAELKRMLDRAESRSREVSQ
jgi:eukaryotic-like serine/threonine-protein kinase